MPGGGQILVQGFVEALVKKAIKALQPATRLRLPQGRGIGGPVPSLDPAVVNEATDETYVEEWTTALNALLLDPAYPLPSDTSQSDALFPILRRPA